MYKLLQVRVDIRFVLNPCVHTGSVHDCVLDTVKEECCFTVKLISAMVENVSSYSETSFKCITLVIDEKWVCWTKDLACCCDVLYTTVEA